MKPEGPVARRADYFVETVELARARALVTEHHYARDAANTAVGRHGLFRRVDGALVGAALWMPPTAGAAKGLALTHLGSQDRAREVLVLSRLVVAPGEPKNAAGLLLGASTRLVLADERWSLLVTYADEAEGHTGTIYRATGWTPDGWTQLRARWIDPATGRRVATKAKANRTHAEMHALGYVRLEDSRKARFVKLRRSSRA